MCGKGMAKSKERSLEKALKFSKKKSVYLKNPSKARLKTMPRIKKSLGFNLWGLKEMELNGFGLEREEECFTKGFFWPPPPAQLVKHLKPQRVFLKKSLESFFQ